MSDHSDAPTSHGDHSDIPTSQGDMSENEEAVEVPFADETEELQRDLDMDEMDEEEDAEDLNDTQFNDYQADPEQDHYEADVDNDEEFSELGHGDVRAIDEQMNRRDERQRRLLQGDGSDDEEVEEIRRRRERRAEERDRSIETPQIKYEERDATINIGDTRGLPLRDFLALEHVQREIGAQYTMFLNNFVLDGVNVYDELIKTMCNNNEASLHVDITHLGDYDGCNIVAMYLIDAPVSMLKILDAATKQRVLKVFPNYEDIHKEIHVRLTNLPIDDSLRKIRQSQLNTLVKVRGVVTRRTGVFPQLKYVQYDCNECSHVLGPFMMENGGKDIKLGACPSCQARGSFEMNTQQTVYNNFQQITIQESPGTVPPGRLPVQKKVVLHQDLVDSCKPGDEIDLTAIYRNNFDIALNKQQGFPVFTTILEANNVQRTDTTPSSLTQKDKKLIRDMGADPSIGQKIINSIAPAIHGHENIKTAIALALFGGEAKYGDARKHRVRGDIHILICGDPGTGKSQFLKYIEKTAPRCVYTTGQGASATGLTCSVHKDQITGEWVLEGGALVLADKGVCLIDEFDKMNDQDRTSIHEAMEQQTISISKASIVTSLQARCSVIAAANPRNSNYNPACTFSQNVDLTEPILSRFDILCVVLDKFDMEKDQHLAEFVVNSHFLYHPENRDELEKAAQHDADNMQNTDRIPQDILRKYIKYAKHNVHPKLTNIDSDKLTKIYGVLRKEAMITNSIPITVRHLESMLRISEAHAKMHLREYVEDEDVNIAVRVMLEAFISTQKASVMNKLKKSLSRFLTYKHQFNDLLARLLEEQIKSQCEFLQNRRGAIPNVIDIPIEDFQVNARSINVRDLSPFFNSEQFKNTGCVIDGNVIRKTADFSPEIF